MQYILSRHGVWAEQTFSTLDEAFAEAFGTDGQYFIQVFSDRRVESAGRYGVEVVNGVATVAFKAPKASS